MFSGNVALDRLRSRAAGSATGCITVSIEELNECVERRKSPRFDQTYCSQCGREFGPGNHGYSHCNTHPYRSIG